MNALLGKRRLVPQNGQPKSASPLPASGGKAPLAKRTLRLFFPRLGSDRLLQFLQAAQDSLQQIAVAHLAD